MEVKTEEERLTYDIDKISDNIRKKYRALKRGIRESDELFRKSYHQILEPLETISQQLGSKKTTEEAADEPLLHRLTKQEEQEADTHRATTKTSNESANSETEEEEEELLFPPEGRYDEHKHLDFSGSLARKYIRLSESTKHIMDHIYGMRYQAGQWMIGDSKVKIDENDNIHIKGKRYKGTPGLYELMFLRLPIKYNKKDMSTYKSILMDTNAHKKYYKDTTQLNGNRGVKYKTIISKLFGTKERKHKGRGLLMKHTPNAAIDYVHWDDPNELVDRLRLLTASQRSGHTGHMNEIASIVEELREAHVIV